MNGICLPNWAHHAYCFVNKIHEVICLLIPYCFFSCYVNTFVIEMQIKHGPGNFIYVHLICYCLLKNFHISIEIQWIRLNRMIDEGSNASLSNFRFMSTRFRGMAMMVGRFLSPCHHTMNFYRGRCNSFRCPIDRQLLQDSN